jgi:hypothetical protein
MSLRFRYLGETTQLPGKNIQVGAALLPANHTITFTGYWACSECGSVFYISPVFAEGTKFDLAYCPACGKTK